MIMNPERTRGAPGHKIPSMSYKGQVQTVANHRREGMQRQGGAVKKQYCSLGARSRCKIYIFLILFYF